MTLSITYLTFDCTDPARLATFWCAALGYQMDGDPGEWAVIRDPAGTRTPMLFQRVSELKAAKNRFHPDLQSQDKDADVQGLLDLGAARAPGYEETESTTVLQDPEGNEFCIFKH